MPVVAIRNYAIERRYVSAALCLPTILNVQPRIDYPSDQRACPAIGAENESHAVLRALVEIDHSQEAGLNCRRSFAVAIPIGRTDGHAVRRRGSGSLHPGQWPRRLAEQL